jgi:hypothetical protein
MLSRREVHEPVDPALRPRHAPREDVLPQQVRRVARLGRLPRRDVPGLPDSDLE